MSRFMTTAALILALIDVAHAQYVWLEREGTARRVRTSASGSTISGKKPAVCSTGSMRREFFSAQAKHRCRSSATKNHLEFATKGRGNVRFVDSSVPPREDKDKGGVTKTIYYAKAGRAETTAKLDLELVPIQASGKILFCCFLTRRSRRLS